MDFLTLKQRLARRLNKNASTLDALTSSRFNDYINEAHRALLTDLGMSTLRDDVLTFATVASQQRYALPAQGVARINRIWDTSDERTLKRESLAWLRGVDPNPQTGTPDYWIPLSQTQVATQPSDASEIFVKSTASGDTSQVCYIEGIITGGYRQTASVTLTGTTAVTLSATLTNFIQVDKFYLSATAAGTVTLHEDSGSGTELARIAIGDTYAKYHSFLLYPTPSSAVTLSVDFTRSIAEMSNDTDEPLIDEDFHDLLIDMAELAELVKSDDPARYQMVRDRVRGRRLDFRSWVFIRPDDGSSRTEGSNLGPWFPAGRW